MGLVGNDLEPLGELQALAQLLVESLDVTVLALKLETVDRELRIEVNGRCNLGLIFIEEPTIGNLVPAQDIGLARINLHVITGTSVEELSYLADGLAKISYPIVRMKKLQFPCLVRREGQGHFLRSHVGNEFFNL